YKIFKISTSKKENRMTGNEDRYRTEQRVSLIVSSTAMCAALYAIGCYTTAWIISPWGFGQFRPAVIIPAFFGIIFGPIPSSLGAAIGTLIADSAKHGTLHLGSLIAAVPGNFIGFYILGHILRKFNWTRFIYASIISLIVGNAVTAFLYVFLYRAFYLQKLPLFMDTLMFISLGLMIYWFITMLPFILLITPLLIRIFTHVMPSKIPEKTSIYSLKNEIPSNSFTLAMIISGLLMLSIGLLTTFTPLRDFTITAAKLTSTLLVELMYYVSGTVLIALGFIMRIRKFLS
ncbi:MAG: hypothetical protein ACUVQ0_06945, partial [Thermoproteota archaeon]